jgi:SGNH hydrolase-like domain, acetyltransferase AlgX
MAREATAGSASAVKAPGATARRGPPSWKARIGLAVAGLLLPLLLAEIALRVAGAILPGDYQTASFAEAHPEFGRRNRPGAGWKKTSEYTSWIEVNSKGLRGAEIDYPKPPGERRILVVGDSFTFAEQVNQNETFSQRLEDRLNTERSNQGTFRVLNAGSNGWATANEAVYLAKEGVRFSPDVVVVAMYLGNDVYDNFSRVATVQDAADADLELRGADSFDGPRRLLRRSELYSVFESGVLAKLPWWNDNGGSASSSDRKPPRTQAEADEAWAITERLLDRMRDVSESQGAQFVVMVVPAANVVAQRGGPAAKDSDDEADEDDSSDVKPGMDDPHGQLAAITARNNLTTLDLLSAMRKADNRVKERLYFRQNAHWTAAGHAIAADELYDFLAEHDQLALGAAK